MSRFGMSSSQEWVQRREAVMPRGVGQILAGTSVVSGQGAWLTNADGRKLIDFSSGIGVTNTGHCPPEVVAAIQNQAATLMHACIHVATYEPYLNLCEKLAELLPHGNQTKVFLTNTGAEAVENAIKIARQATGRAGVICFSEGFHGRTLMALSLTSKVGYKQGCGPFAPEVYRLPFPNYFRYHDGLDHAAFISRELERFRQALVNTVAPEQVAAVIIEPIQGEGGFVPAPAAYLQGLRQICDQYGILLIFDEVQSGFGRAGDWSAYAESGVTPDLSTWAKAMGGGLPIACVIGKAAVMDACLPGTLGGTYGGNPLSCAASLAVIDIMQRDNLPQRAAQMGELIQARFRQIQSKCALVADVRGRGMMQAMEFCFERDPLRPAGDLVKAIMAGCYEQGLLIINAGSAGNVIRTLPPLMISEADLILALDILESQILKFAPE
jgi:4-aminobutyrate aminotransferase / (S)-3-amino-2-methylpropionate transaminase / 5-aminovalerate transaminase